MIQSSSGRNVKKINSLLSVHKISFFCFFEQIFYHLFHIYDISNSNIVRYFTR